MARKAPARKPTFPRYCKQKRSRGVADAYVEIEGRRFYLGRHGSPQSWEKYTRLRAEWAANGNRLAVDPEDITVVELAARFLEHAREYYRRPDGSQSNEVADLSRVLRLLNDLYGTLRVCDFGPRALKAVRQSLIERDVTRTYVNKTVERIRRVFKWGVAEEIVPPHVLHALQAVTGLKRGRCSVREPRPVRPVAREHVDAIKSLVSPQIWALIQLQLLTAARPGELLRMRPCEIDTAGKIWTYTPEAHKTAHHGHARSIYIGPRAKLVLRPFLVRPPTAFLFSPREAMDELRRQKSRERKTPLSCGNRPGTNCKETPRKVPGEHYTVQSYGQAIERACKAAGIPPWRPNRLRHSAATFIRKEFGLEVARIILGHRSPVVTEIYAELDREKALEVMERIG